MPNLIAHLIERLTKDQPPISDIYLLNPKIFGLDAENALLAASLSVHMMVGGFDTPQTYGFALRTDDCGKTWVQVFDPVDRRIPPITDVRFIGKRGLLLYEDAREGNRFGFFYSQDWGQTWLDSEIREVTGSYSLVDWSVRRPHEGVAVVASDSGVPIDGDNSRETGYWIIRTPNGFRWTVDEVIERGYEAGFLASNYIYPPEWDEPSELWAIREADDVLSVVNNGIAVLQLSMNRVWSGNTSEH